jgi:hypothetical protein
MLHVPFNDRSAPPIAAIALPPLSPAEYLRLRRKAAKLSIAEVAARLAPDSALRGEAATFLRLIEKPGNRVSRNDTLLRLEAVFPFDPSVYTQLCDEPADRHPQVCRGCGCSHWDPCDTDGRGPCAWSSASTCTRCAPEGGDL